jgi:hypothetical protein
MTQFICRADYRIKEDIDLKRTFILLCLIVMIFGASGCTNASKAPDRDLSPSPTEVPKEPEETVYQQVTSKDAELYIARNVEGERFVVNPYGMIATDYRVDETGNIVFDDGTIMISHDNAICFEEIESLEFAEEEYTVTLDPLNLPMDYYYSGQYTQYSVPFQISLKISNPKATNQIIFLESSDSEIISIRANQNAKLIADGMFDVEPNCLAIQPMDPAKPVDIVVTAKTVGEATLTARALSGYASAECAVNVEYGEGDRSGVPESWLKSAAYNTAAHIHSYSSSIIEPTVFEEGFTLYTCEECGHSYKGNFSPKLSVAKTGENTPHVHNYSASTVAPTDTERGYTLYTCQECGDNYKANFIDPTK